MSLRPYFWNRDFSERFDRRALRWEVNSLEWEAVGGCSQASLTAYGPESELWECIERLRCPISIQDEKGRWAWWGYVSECAVRIGAVEVGASLASMTNKVAVAYSYIDPGSQVVGTRKTTAWASDTESIAAYGTKEWISSQGGMTDAGALARRNAALAKQKWPAAVSQQAGSYPRGRVRPSGAENSQSASLICRGWFETLDWRYASVSTASGPSYQTSSVNSQLLGQSSTNPKMVQQFTVGSDGAAVTGVDVPAYQVGVPSDYLVATIYALDGSGYPTGAALATGQVAGNTLQKSALAQARILLSVNLAAGQYGLQMSRSGAVSGSDYYVIGVDQSLGYAGGACYVWNGSAWVSPSPNADMRFTIVISGQVESTRQITTLASSYGQFLTGTTIDSASGVWAPGYRSGDTTAGEEIRQLLAQGGPSGRRYLAEITPERRLHVWEEAATTTVNWYLNRWGVLSSDVGLAVVDYLPPVGVWARLRDVIPASADVSKLADPTLQFIEGAAWSGDGTKYRFRGQPSIDEIMRIQ